MSKIGTSKLLTLFNLLPFEEFRNVSGKLICFDIGTMTTGVSFSDMHQSEALPAGHITHNWQGLIPKDEANHLRRKIKNFSGLIVGYPLSLDGSEGRQCQKTLSVLATLIGCLNLKTLPLLLVDERYSTLHIKQEFSLEAYKKHGKDCLSALSLLESYLWRKNVKGR